MRAKLSVLRACRRLLRPGGRLAFYTIFIPAGLSEAEFRRVQSLGDPPEVVAGAVPSELLRSAGFGDFEEIDVTDEYVRTASGWYEARERYASELRLQGEAEFAESQANSKKRLGLIRAGLLRRSLFVAQRRPLGRA